MVLSQQQIDAFKRDIKEIGWEFVAYQNRFTMNAYPLIIWLRQHHIPEIIENENILQTEVYRYYLPHLFIQPKEVKK